jgi:hypothetical protein
VFGARGELVDAIEHDPNVTQENSGRLGAL